MPQIPKHLMTKAGKPYTYLGWVRAFNATRDSNRRLELRGAYPEYARKHHEILDKPKSKPKPKAPAQPRRSRGRLLTSTRPEYPRLSVHARAYRGMDGYVISGRDTINRNVSIFARTKQEANRIKRDLLAGEPVRFDNEGSITIVHRH